MNKTMKDYIFEGHQRGLELIEDRIRLTSDLVAEIETREIRSIWIVASGSSFNSAMCAKPFMTKLLKRDINVVTPASFVAYDYQSLLADKDLVIVISQTGYSTNAIEALKKLRELGIKSIGVTGNLDSDFKHYCDLMIDYGVGIETVGYVTKGVTTLVLFLMLLALEAAKSLNLIEDALYVEKVTQLQTALRSHPEIIKRTDEWIEDNIKSLSGVNVIYFIAYGSNFGSALEAALKFGETVLVPTMAYEMEEYIHGNNLQLTPNYSVVVFDNGDFTSQKAHEVYLASKAVTDRTYLITSKESNDVCNIVVPFNGDETMNPLVTLPVIQTLASTISATMGRKQHPLLENFKKEVHSKTENYVETE